MRVLIKAGADTHAKAQDGTTLFLAAASSSRVEAAKLAFEYDKDMMRGRHAIDGHASFFGGANGAPTKTEMAQYLADIGVPLDGSIARGRTPCKAGDGAPFDKPIQRIAEIIYAAAARRSISPRNS